MGVQFAYVSWQMTTALFVILLPMMFFAPIYGQIIQMINRKISDRKATLSGAAEESFSNIRTVKAFGSEDRESLEFGKLNDKVYSQ